MYASGIIYTGSSWIGVNAGIIPAYVDAYRTSDGSQLWGYPISTGSSAESTLVNGVLYMVDCNSGITALRMSDGIRVWHVQEGSQTLDKVSGALEAVNGTVYVTYNHNSIY